MLSKRQKDTLEFIRSHIIRKCESPSLEEIAAGTGINSRAAAHRHVRALSEAGYIKLIQGRKRGIQLLDGEHNNNLFELTLAGQIAAGKPIEAISGQDTFDFGKFLGSDHFALRVKGNSMIEDGIVDGDTVVIQQTTNARNGDIVVALIDGEEATLKRLKKNKSTITLIPANKQLKPVAYDAKRINIQGILIGLIRSY